MRGENTRETHLYDSIVCTGGQSFSVFIHKEGLHIDQNAQHSITFAPETGEIEKWGLDTPAEHLGAKPIKRSLFR